MQKRVIMQYKWLLREIGPSICAWNTTHHLVLTVSASDLRATNLSYFWQLTDVSCFLRAASTAWTFSIGPVSLAFHPLILWIAIYLIFLAMSQQTLSKKVNLVFLCCRTLFRSHGPTTCNYFSSCAILHPIPMSIGVRFSITPRVCFQWVSWERLLWRESFRINRPLIPPFSWATTLHILHFEYCLHIEVKSQGAFYIKLSFSRQTFDCLWATHPTNIEQFAHWTLHTQRTKIILFCVSFYFGRV